MMQLLYWKKEDEEAVSDFEWKQKIQTNKNNKHGEGLKTKWEQQIFISKLFPSYWHCIVAGLPIFAEGKLSQTGHTHSTRQQQNDCVHTTQEMQIHAGIYVTALNCCMKSVKKTQFWQNGNEKDYCTCCEGSSLLLWKHYRTGEDIVSLVKMIKTSHVH